MRLPCHWLQTKLHLSKCRDATYLGHIKHQSYLFSHISHIANNHINPHRVFGVNNHQWSIISNQIKILTNLNLIFFFIYYNRLPICISKRIFKRFCPSSQTFSYYKSKSMKSTIAWSNTNFPLIL